MPQQPVPCRRKITYDWHNIIKQTCKQPLSDHLVISAVGEDRPGIVDKLSKAIFNTDCSIVDSRMTVLGGEFAIILLVSGHANDISQLEETLPGMQDTLALTISVKRTSTRTSRSDSLAYSVRAVSIDHPGIVYKLASFFSTRNINIDDLATSRYAAAHTGTPMFSIDMVINIPADVRISRLREDLTGFCDDLNIDVNIEPEKG
jgi:glycine cleavage system transcriptional repressor